MIKKYWKKFLKILLIIISTIVVFFTINENKSNADAGYHASYSGGHSSSHSSHSYGSSSSSNLSDGEEALVMFITFAVIIIISCIVSAKQNKDRLKITKLQSNQTALNKIKQILPDFNEEQFLQEGYKIFLDIEKAWMDCDMEKVHNVITDEMFNMYESQLSTMEVKGEQNIMKDFVLKDSCISNATVQNGSLEVTTKYVIEFYDYIIDKASKKVLRGSSTRKLRMYYEFTYIINSKQEKVDKCPNCGAPVNVNSAGVCEYCSSKIIGKNTTWVMSKKLCNKQINL